MRKAILINPVYSTVGDTLCVWYELQGYLFCSWNQYIGFLEPFVLKISDVNFIKE